MSEKEFQGIVMELASLHGYELAYHTHDSRRSAPGFPDLVLVSPKRARVLFRELKTDVGRVSPDQRKWVDGLTAAGADAGVWRPADLVSGRVVAELKGA
ncbi:VRR-NUC domain-containing protein [Arthrobacter sp. SLBN-83]|uniref:VRR-NUC domain-containing protein n=1 Tax=Arthrobacter sp. SLBN-83 TaxID=2768449 RepID=UPI00114DCC55|nr:VRR-NUC domain-containing protein [Arthrobacter sp. SLBN-83]